MKSKNKKPNHMSHTQILPKRGCKCEVKVQQNSRRETLNLTKYRVSCNFKIHDLGELANQNTKPDRETQE